MSQGGEPAGKVIQSVSPHLPQDQPPAKKIRFITSHGAPHPKRRRVGAACLTCRKRKVACSGEKPACATCLQNKSDCSGYDAITTNSTSVNVRDDTKSVREGAEPIKPIRGESIHHHQSSVPVQGSIGNPSNSDKYGEPLENIPEGEEEDDSCKGSSAALFAGPRNRMPYFRWLGPTAIMPGFKQMVVKVKQRDATNDKSSTHSNDGGAMGSSPRIQRTTSVLSTSPLPLESDGRTPMTLPFYDTSPAPPSELITHLCNTFFIHLGCNFPFLQRGRFLKDLEEKEVDAILVDAVCALAARFSSHHLLTQQTGSGENTSPSEYGSIFAQRAQETLMHTFATPSVAAVQAALLLAYNEFGEGRDSGLWMYLGISIRLAQDLGLQKLDGFCYEGKHGPTPKMFKRNETKRDNGVEETRGKPNQVPEDGKNIEEQRAVERERIDTFWAVFFLDRVVSSGTGRRSTLRDKDIELSFPSLDTKDPETGWPSPFPALIRIVHLYGRVADLLNGIKEPSDITESTSRKLADMETRVTNFYQGLSIKLHFQAMNFYHYVNAGEGTNFVLLHFWFHTLIILLHQPTLLKTFEGKMLQLFPNSQQLAMSSAKTIADILSYSQLIDTKASLGNPFTTQPIYIAACAFLKETAEQTATSKEQSRTQSRSNSPGGSDVRLKASSSKSAHKHSVPTTTNISPSGRGPMPLTVADRLIARHTLLATAASQHYQLCFKALESLETYWAGTKYILTVLDQKFKGVGDPLLYTAEEGESSFERPNPKAEEAFKMPGWRRRVSWGTYAGQTNSIGLRNTWLGAASMTRGNVVDYKDGEVHDASQAIGWALTGTLNSPSTNLACHFPSGGQDGNNAPMDHLLPFFDLPTPNSSKLDSTMFSPGRQYADLDIAFSPFNINKRNHDMSILDHGLCFSSGDAEACGNTTTVQDPFGTLNTNTIHGSDSHAKQRHVNEPRAHQQHESKEQQHFQLEEMLIESQDVDTSLLGLDTLPWFDALPGDFESVCGGDMGHGEIGVESYAAAPSIMMTRATTMGAGHGDSEMRQGGDRGGEG